ncbi:MAG: ribose 5-phosphate isomerase B [Holosporaceae bacterium]|jgi:ribose 5-phosphate isomerase B|nr:ribose 5-phosphate isomerase B [Holosporaceae bacterium]
MKSVFHSEIFIASDHAGFSMKQYLMERSGYNLVDLGTDSLESCDYSVFAEKLSKRILKEEDHCGILICSTGIGMSIAANRHKGIRAALCFDRSIAELARRHNDANVVIFGARVVGCDAALDCLRVFLSTQFEGGRHIRRLRMIDVPTGGE